MTADSTQSPTAPKAKAARRGMSRVLFRSTSDRWETPRAVYDALDREFHFDFDPCPLDATIDGLAPETEWRGKRVFCNPPYGPNISKWIDRGYEAALAVFLIPARTDTKWFHELVLPHAIEIRFLRGRIKFGDSRKDAPFPSMAVVFKGKRAIANPYVLQLRTYAPPSRLVTLNLIENEGASNTGRMFGDMPTEAAEGIVKVMEVAGVVVKREAVGAVVKEGGAG